MDLELRCTVPGNGNDRMLAHGSEVLAGEAVEKTTGSVEFGEKLFFGAEFAGVGDEAATGASGGVFDMEHFVIEDIFDDELRDERMVHAAVEKDLVGAGVVAAELAAPTAPAPAEMRALEISREELSV